MPKLNRSSAKKSLTLNRKVTKFVAHNDAVDFNQRLKQNPIFTPTDKALWAPTNPSFIASMLRGGR
jgi:hypothetical protein